MAHPDLKYQPVIEEGEKLRKQNPEAFKPAYKQYQELQESVKPQKHSKKNQSL